MKKRFNNHYFILRHGQTSQQVKRKNFVYNWPDKPPAKLTLKGIGQIKKAARALKREKIGLIYSSDIYRTRQTAGIVAKELGLKINLDKRLRDVNLGVYHGKAKEIFFRDFPLNKKRFTSRPKKGESWNDIKKRLSKFIKEIEKKHKNKRVLIISHGDPIFLLRGIVKGLSDGQIIKNLKNNLYIEPGELRRI